MDEAMGIDDFNNTPRSFCRRTFSTASWRAGRFSRVLPAASSSAQPSSPKANGQSTQQVYFVETYTFGDGQVDTLRWLIRKVAEGKYAGNELLVMDEAMGEQAGSFHWKYKRATNRKIRDTMPANAANSAITRACS